MGGVNVDQTLFLRSRFGSDISDKVDSDKSGGQGTQSVVLHDFNPTCVPLWWRPPREASGFRVIGELAGVIEVNPQDDVLVKVPDDGEGMLECLGLDLYLKFVNAGHVQGLATGSMAGFRSLV